MDRKNNFDGVAHTPRTASVALQDGHNTFKHY